MQELCQLFFAGPRSRGSANWRKRPSGCGKKLPSPAAPVNPRPSRLNSGSGMARRLLVMAHDAQNAKISSSGIGPELGGGNRVAGHNLPRTGRGRP